MSLPLLHYMLSPDKSIAAHVSAKFELRSKKKIVLTSAGSLLQLAFHPSALVNALYRPTKADLWESVVVCTATWLLIGVSLTYSFYCKSFAM